MNTKVWKIGDETPYGQIVEKPFGDGIELIPEKVHHLPDPEGGPLLNQFCFVDESRPWDTEFWCTQSPDKGVPGFWDGRRKLRTVKLTDASPYAEVTLLETNWQSDNTFGQVRTSVAILKDGTVYVAANPNSMRRFSGSSGILEGTRNRHGSEDVTPQVTDGDAMVENEYDMTDMGLLLTNSACIHAVKPDGTLCLARVRAELTTYSNIVILPDLNAPFVWVELAEFMFLSMDIHTQGIVGRGLVAGYIPMPPTESVADALGALPDWVVQQTA